MNLRRLPAYLNAALRTVAAQPPRAWLKLLARSPYTVADLPDYGVSMIVDVRDPAISKPILVLGEYEKPLTRALLARVDEHTRFLDVGANLGFFTLLVARRATRGRVWSIEPDPDNVRLLRANVALNGFEDRVEVHPAAASDAEGTVYLSSLGDVANLGARFTARAESTLRERSPSGAPAPSPVRAVTVDGLLTGGRPTLVKIDVEGSEPAVLAGMARVLEEDRPAVFCEFAPGTIRHLSKCDPREMLEAMRARRYAFFAVEPDGALSALGHDPAAVLARHGGGRRHHIDLALLPEEKA